jgi:hypothetical protein
MTLQVKNTWTNKNINFPWKYYPVSKLGNILSEYTHYNIYREQTIELYDYFLNFNPNQTLVYLAIGDAMEEIKNINVYETHDQWRQLFPIYIETAATSRHVAATEIIIVTPNINCNPDFIKKTQTLFKWNKIKNNHYKSGELKYNINVRVFITPLPCIDPKNIELMKHLKEKNQEIFTESQINELEQTTNDINFLNEFNLLLTQYINKVRINGAILCNYFAVFNNKSLYSAYNNFYFSPILKSLIKNLDKNIVMNALLLKWTYITTNTTTALSLPLPLPSQILDQFKFSYISNYSNNSCNLEIIKEDDILKFVIYDKKQKYNTIHELIKLTKHTK